MISQLLLINLPCEVLESVLFHLDVKSQLKLAETCKALNKVILIHPRIITVLDYDNNYINSVLYNQILTLDTSAYRKFIEYLKVKDKEEIMKSITIVKVFSMNDVHVKFSNLHC